MSQELVALGKYRVPKDRLYTKTHEWVKIEGSTAIIGITDYAQSKLKNVVGVELPEVGKEVPKGSRLAVVESIKSVEDVYAPISIKVTEVNERLEDEPELINRDPYGEGWIAKGEVLRKEELDELLSPEKYVEVIESEEK
ncbi:MAG: glycine cleavage system protein GcvH [Crenarchaeota archaeon]|nr:glycine cleavage system protein GcvH [Thermoproteota archaeon]